MEQYLVDLLPAPPHPALSPRCGGRGLREGGGLHTAKLLLKFISYPRYCVCRERALRTGTSLTRNTALQSVRTWHNRRSGFLFEILLGLRSRAWSPVPHVAREVSDTRRLPAERQRRIETAGDNRRSH